MLTVQVDFVFPFSVWTFDKQILSIDADSPGLIVVGRTMDGTLEGPDAFSVEQDINAPPPEGGQWQCVPANVHITFVDGSVLQAGSGFLSPF